MNIKRQIIRRIMQFVKTGMANKMTYRIAAGFLLIIFLTGSCSKPEVNWLKGNVHTHTFWSDGDEFPESVVQWYKEHGYNFLALTDHNVILEGERWRNFPEGHAALQKYIDTFGEEWVEVHSHETEEGVKRVRLKTLEEFRTKYEDPGKFLLIMGNEISNPHAVHLLALHQNKVIPAIKADIGERERIIRETVDNLKSYREKTGINTHAALAHPNFRWAITAEMMINVPDLRFFEVYNGHPQVNNDGDQFRAGTEKIWDIVMAHRLTTGEGELLFGFATDDAHNYHGGETGPGKGWIMVRSDELSPEAILDAVDKGNFYASTGVVLKDFSFKGNKIDIEIVPQEGVEYTTEFVGTLKGTDIEGRKTLDAEGNEIDNTTMTYSENIGQVLAADHSLNPSYSFKGNELYVRARIISSASHIDPNTGKVLGKQKAWVRPYIQQ